MNDLDELLSIVSEDNIHSEVETASPIGNEEW
jgi:hypothetical protein